MIHTMGKKIVLFFSSLFLLSGCGEIEFPESTDVPTSSPVTVVTPKTVNPEISASPETTPVSIDNISEEYKKIKVERDNLSEAVKISQEELKTCSLQKSKLDSQLSTQQQSQTVDVKKFSGILNKYLTQVDQPEYPFDPAVCGGLGKATSQSWYPDFVLQLEKSGLQFAPLHRPLQADDFGGVCASTKGKIAIFLGASYKGKSDFHLVKYSIDSKTLEEAVLMNGSCTVCPSQFGKRIGPALTLIGQLGSTKKTYQYYYDANIVVEK